MINFFEWLFNNDYYTLGCTIAAFFLFYNSVLSKKLPLFILSIEFIACLIVGFVGMTLTGWLDNSGIFFAYFLIQLLAISFLLFIAIKGVEVPVTICVLIAIAAIYNILMIAPYHGYTVFGFSGQQMYDIYSNLLGFIMLIQLIYMASYNKLLISKLGKYARTYTVFADRFYMSYCWARVGGVS